MPLPRYRTRAKLLWDDACLYVGVEIEEPQLQASLMRRGSPIEQRDNDIKLFIDPDGDSHLYCELELNAFNAAQDLLLVKPYRDGGLAVAGFELAGLRSAVHLDGSLNDPRDVDRGWSVELALPWTALQDIAGTDCPPRQGDCWRMNFSRLEWRYSNPDGLYVKELDPVTATPFPADNWVWSPQGLMSMHYPERWGFVAFANDEWPEFLWDGHQARFKAQAELYRIYYLEQQYRERTGAYTADWQALDYDPATLVGDEYELSLEATSGTFSAELSDMVGSYLRINHEGKLDSHFEPCG